MTTMRDIMKIPEWPKKWIMDRVELYLEHSEDSKEHKKGFMLAVGMFGLLHDSDIRYFKEKYELFEDQ